MDAAAERFEASRDRLASLAYRLLGSAADAEDAVQDAFLRWQAADRDRVEVPEAWLTKAVTNLCLDRLRSAPARRERTVDQLPEPLLEGDPMLGPADTAEQRESVSLAVLTLMRDLTPLQRAAYVLREAFSYSHLEIAGILEVSESASQQHVHRARAQIAAGRRVRDRAPADPASARRVVEEFLAAAASGRTERLVALLTADASGTSDAAGLAEKTMEFDGPERLAAAFRAFYKPSEAKRRLAGGTPAIYAGIVNGEPAIVAVVDGSVVGALVLELDGDLVAMAHGVAKRSRLQRLDRVWRREDRGEPLLKAW